MGKSRTLDRQFLSEAITGALRLCGWQSELLRSAMDHLELRGGGATVPPRQVRRAGARKRGPGPASA